MEDINWQDPFKKESLEEASFESQITKNHSPSNSFANQFTGMRSRREEETFNGQNMQPTFSDRYLQAAQNGESISDIDDTLHGNAYQTRPSERIEKKPIYEKIPIQKGDRNSFPKWRFLDLKNKKQTGDLYKKILYFNKKNGCKAFCFTSSRGSEGVSTVLANLVDYIRNQPTGKTIMVIDANFEYPNLHTIFNIPKNTRGLIDVFSNRIGVREALTPISPNIFVLTCGNISNNKSWNLEPDNFIKLLNECRQLVDYVLIDCPPVLSSSDSLSIAPAADISFLIIQSLKVQKPVAQKAVSILQNDECEIGGIILNRVKHVIPGWVYKFI